MTQGFESFLDTAHIYINMFFIRIQVIFTKILKKLYIFSNCDNSVVAIELVIVILLIILFFIGSNLHKVGAGSENRTRATRSEAWHSTTKLYPHFLLIVKKRYLKYRFFVEQVVGIEPT